MNVEYTEYKGVTKIVDPEQFWIKWCNDGAIQADEYWHRCYDSGEAYCYGRNDVYLNLYYAETRKQILKCTIIPPETWIAPNNAFAKLITL